MPSCSGKLEADFGQLHCNAASNPRYCLGLLQFRVQILFFRVSGSLRPIGCRLAGVFAYDACYNLGIWQFRVKIMFFRVSGSLRPLGGRFMVFYISTCATVSSLAKSGIKFHGDVHTRYCLGHGGIQG